MAFSAGKDKGKKQVAKWQSWEKSAQDRKFLIVGGALVVFTAVILVSLVFRMRSAMVERTLSVQSRPTLINIHPPELLQPFICDASSGSQGANNVQTFLKNIGSSGATDVSTTFLLQVVPEQRVGLPSVDEIPSGSCRDKPRGSRRTAALSPGEETTPRLPLPSMMLPPLLSGEAVQLYGVSCVFYSDNSRNDHAVCDTYRFRPIRGTPVFVCDGTQRAGKFDEASIANCGN
jgi:hypothetical protein